MYRIAFVFSFIGLIDLAFGGPIPKFGNDLYRWNIDANSDPLDVYIDAANSDLESIAQEAVDMWESVSTAYISFITVSTESEADIIIRFPGSDAFPPHSYAEPTITDGFITRCIAHNNSTSGSREDLRALVLHEFGHCLGLLHSISYGSTMSYISNSNLNADDRYQLTVLYPNEADSLPLSCASIVSPNVRSREIDGFIQNKKSNFENKANLIIVLSLCTLGWICIRRRELRPPLRS